MGTSNKTALDYPLPENEQDRLNALYDYQLIQSLPDDEFTDLTSIAERELGVSVAAVTLVDDKQQYLKSIVGANCTVTPREKSYCTYTILDDDALVVEDTWEDDRFGKDYLYVEGQEVRSYAGYPLVTENGHRFGSFCVFSFEPQEFTPRDLELLRLLRNQAMCTIESHHQEQQLRQLAHFDSITGFGTRYHFMNEFEELVAADSLGLTLVSNLAEKQLNGDLNVQNEQGTEFRVSFPEAVTDDGGV
ncbi:MAG: GAF domain-containing protein [bacterium]